ncbi:MAG TPA: hypothetical protein PKX76_00400, partial [Flexilinea sp.]|nr:hypothetical protein [Flexilinea sp.]
MRKSVLSFQFLFILSVLAFATCFIIYPVYAQDANSLIAEVNALRASYGLSPYTVDNSLSSLAQ